MSNLFGEGCTRSTSKGLSWLEEASCITTPEPSLVTYMSERASLRATDQGAGRVCECEDWDIPEYPTDNIVNDQNNDQNVPGLLLDTRTFRFTAPE
jgi:hypothetical protein